MNLKTREERDIDIPYLQTIYCFEDKVLSEKIEDDMYLIVLYTLKNGELVLQKSCEGELVYSGTNLGINCIEHTQ